MGTPTFVILTIVCFASLALADDFKTVNGKEYKDATVSRIEPDGIVIHFKGGIVKILFTELPNEVQQRFGYDPAKIEAESAAARAAETKRIDEEKKREENAESDLKRSLEQFQTAEQRATQSYQNAKKGTLSGQIFVTTKGAGNYKLGAIQVGLFARDAIDTLLQGLKRYADIKIQQLRPSVDTAWAAYEQAEAAERAAFDVHLKSILNRDSERAWNDAKGAAAAARDQHFKASRELGYYYSGAFYFGFLGFAIQMAETDAEGKFVIEVPQAGDFVIAAQAERSVIENTERYYWLQPVSLEGQQQRVQNLSNNNLTSTTGTSSLTHTKD